jgi:abequosyltransferase
MQRDRPLLTIAIPTYRRCNLLCELLTVLAPQFQGRPDVELLVSDNASPDGTAQVVQRFIDEGLSVSYHRHPENIGPDANFVSCFHLARGKYFWLFSDDDILVPGALAEILYYISRQEYDLVYATSYGFRTNWQTERHQDPLNRRFHTVDDARVFAKIVNIMITFISGIIVNKQRLEEIPHEDPSAFLDTNLVQLSWALPLLDNHRRSLVLWNRPVAARQGNAGGYAFGTIFGEKLTGITARCLPSNPQLATYITDFALRRWFPSIIFDIRSSENKNLYLDQATNALSQCYGRNFRYWLFTIPILSLPIPLARLWLQASSALNKIIYIVSLPNFWRKEI